nr:hypothetical protein [Bradyrhizobium brasilense]
MLKKRTGCLGDLAFGIDHHDSLLFEAAAEQKRRDGRGEFAAAGTSYDELVQVSIVSDGLKIMFVFPPKADEHAGRRQEVSISCLVAGRPSGGPMN